MTPSHSQKLRTPRRRTARAVALAIAMAIGAIGLLPSSPAHALTPNEKYVDRLHRDFLLRPPTTAELAWGAAYLSGSSRSSYVTGFFVSSAFRPQYVGAVYLRYLGRAPSAAEESAASSALQASGNHLATEADVIASSSYFTLTGNDPHEYVRSLFWDILGREGGAVDVDWWADRIINAVQTRRQVAVSFLRGAEASLFRVNGFSWEPGCPRTELTRFDNIENGSYCLVLDRKGSVADANYWAATYSGGGQLIGIWTAFAVSSEYWNLAQA